MTKKDEVINKIKEILSKHPEFQNVDVEIVFKDENKKKEREVQIKRYLKLRARRKGTNA